MCGRVILLSYEELLRVAEQLSASREPQHLEQLDLGLECSGQHARAQARPGAQIAALVQDAAGLLGPRTLRWGFTAPWDNKLVYNTRIESAMRPEGMWASAIQTGRCILPVAAFFEPHETETERSPKTGRQVKRPYRFRMSDATPLLLAGVNDGEQLSVVTTQPNADVARIHRRMPLALRPFEVRAWLGDGWMNLVDRSAVSLHAEPEHPDAALQNQQQSLF